MGCLDSSGFQPDFFNNIAAIAIVLMLTKVVMHRSRKRQWGESMTAVVVGLHVFTVLAAAVAVWISLAATDQRNTALEWHTYAWASLIAAAAGLFADVVVEDVIGACVKKRAHEKD
jgi:hypothetical protein